MPTNVLMNLLEEVGGRWQLGGDTVMYRSVGLRDERRMVLVSGMQPTRAEGNSSRGGLQLDGETVPGAAGWIVQPALWP